MYRVSDQGFDIRVLRHIRMGCIGSVCTAASALRGDAGNEPDAAGGLQTKACLGVAAVGFGRPARGAASYDGAGLAYKNATGHSRPSPVPASSSSASSRSTTRRRNRGKLSSRAAASLISMAGHLFRGLSGAWRMRAVPGGTEGRRGATSTRRKVSSTLDS